MSQAHETLESVAERARRALRDNEAANLQAQRSLRDSEAANLQAQRSLRDSEAANPQAQAAPRAAEGTQREGAPIQQGIGTPSELIDQRIRAIARVKELEPRLASARARAADLSQRLTSTATDSVHYAELLRWLAEVHAQLRQLEAEYEEAQHVIRNSAWVMHLLADPS